MGFWDENEDLAAGGGAFLKAADKAILIEQGTVFTVDGVSVRENRFEEGEYQYVVEVTIPEGVKLANGEPGARQMGFGKGAVESRDRTLDRMSKYLDDPANGGIESVLELVGRSQVIRPANDVG